MTRMTSFDSPPEEPGMTAPSTRDVGPTGAAVLRGREAEGRVIRDLLRRAERGVGGVVLLEGEQGIGKSVLLGGAVDEGARRGFWSAVGAAGRPGQAITFPELRLALGQSFAELTADRADHQRATNRQRATPTWRLGQLRAHLAERAATSPVLVCVDDLQRAGPDTLAALRVLTRELRHQRIAWVLARSSAPEHAARYLFRLLEQEGAVRVRLAPLEQAAVTALLASAFGAPPGPGLLGLAATAAGNPSLLTELVRGLREDGAVQLDQGQATLTSGMLPQRIRQLARRRLDGLGEQARGLLVTAAIAGPSLRLGDAAELLGRTPAMLLPALEEMMAAGIMTADDDTFSFRHQLLRRGVVDTIPPPERGTLHRRYGQLLLGTGGSAALAADHLLRAADDDSPSSLAGLDTAVARLLLSAPQAAADLAVRALELTPSADPDSLSRAVTAAEALAAAGRLDEAGRIADDTLAEPLPPVAEARLRCALSSVLCSRGRARDAAAEARIVLAQPGLPDDVRDRAITAHLQALAGLRGQAAGSLIDQVLAAPDQSDSRAVVAALAARAAASWDKGHIRDGLGLLRDAVRRESGISRDARHVQPLLALAAALVDLRQLAQAEEILRAADRQALHGIPAHAALAILQARIHLANGKLGEAAAAGEDGLAVAEALGAHGYSSAARCVLGLIALRRGDTAAASLHVVGDSVPGPHSAEIYARAEVAVAGAAVSEVRDGPAVALGLVRRLCADLDAHPGLLLGDPALAPWLTRTALAAGHDELAAGVARAAAALASANHGYPTLDAAAAHSLGLAQQDAACLASAAERHPDPWASASAAEDLGVTHARRGDARHAIGQFTEAIRRYQGVGAEADAARVRRRLRRLGVRSRQRARPAEKPVSGWESLTEPERTVAGLVAQGLVNREVAGRMYVSIHTVAFYLSQIFRKLSIGSRVELTRIVVQRGSAEPLPQAE
jgi:DNA-binding CsgD family transcriptional regulator/tetratricopeptide (TPR) repeat protein